MHLSLSTAAASLLAAYLAAQPLQVEAGLLPKARPVGHLNWVKRDGAGEPSWTSKHDSTLLSPEPPAAEIAQAQSYNTHLAKQAFVNLAKLSGRPEAVPPAKRRENGSDEGQEEDHDERQEEEDDNTSQVQKRAARPQGVPAIGEVEHIIPKFLHLAADPNGSKEDEQTPNPAFPYGSTPIRGVNLGGWLVLEPWITPSIFSSVGDPKVVDEWTYGEHFGPVEAGRQLTQHWDTWVTEDDLSQIASLGLNHVRIPIGWWALDKVRTEPYPQGQYPYLFKAVGWAKKHGLKVMIDLHGAPGSQNGFDNSGRRGNVLWHTDQENVNRTKEALQVLLDDFYQPEYQGVVTSIELLNEPAGFVGGNMMEVVKQFYYDGYGQARYPGSGGGNTSASDLLVTIHDAFQPLPSWKGFMPAPSWSNVALDTHYYSIFNQQDLQMSDNDRIQAVCKAKAGLVESNTNLWTLVGEWTPANTDCAASLNGAGVGSRYDGSYPGSQRIGSCEGKTGDASKFSEDFKTFLGKYWEVQATVFESASGWLQWAWKTESADEWSYQKGVEYGWIPRDPSQRQYPNPCQ